MPQTLRNTPLWTSTVCRSRERHHGTVSIICLLFLMSGVKALKLVIPVCAAAALFILRRLRAGRLALESPQYSLPKEQLSPSQKINQCECCGERMAPMARRPLVGELAGACSIGMSKDPVATTKRNCYINWDDVRPHVIMQSGSVP